MIFNLLWLKSNNRIHSIRWGLCIGEDLAEQREQCFFNTDCLFGNSVSSTFAYYIDTFWPRLSVRTQCLKICSAEQLAQNVDSWENFLYIINRKLPFKQKFFFLSSPWSTCIVWWSRLNYFVEIPHFGKYTVLLSFIVKQVFTLKVHLRSFRSH